MSGSHFALGAVLALVAMGMAGRPGAARAEEGNDARARAFIAAYESTIRPMEIEVGRRWWDANTSGKEEVYRRKEEAETKLELRLSDPKTFAELKADQGGTGQGSRSWPAQIDVLYLQFLAKQVDPELLKQMVLKSNAIERAFNVYRPKLERQGTDRQRGPPRAPRVEGLGRAAGRLGGEQGRGPDRREGPQGAGEAPQPGRPQAGLRRLPRDAARPGRAEPGAGAQAVRRAGRADPRAVPPGQGGDRRRAGRQLRHPGLQAPALALPRPVLPGIARRSSASRTRRSTPGSTSSRPAASSTPASACRWTTCIRRSDLYEKPGKNPHAFCTDIDREGDVRVLCNIVPGREWLATMLHELGHGVYSSKNIPPQRALRAAVRVPSADDRGRGDDVRAVRRQPGLAQGDGRERAGAGEVPGRGEEDAAQPTADLLPLVPGDVPLREGAVRQPGPGPQQAVVGPGGEVPGGEAARRPQRAGLRQPRSTSSSPRSITTTT